PVHTTTKSPAGPVATAGDPWDPMVVVFTCSWPPRGVPSPANPRTNTPTADAACPYDGPLSHVTTKPPAGATATAGGACRPPVTSFATNSAESGAPVASNWRPAAVSADPSGPVWP